MPQAYCGCMHQQPRAYGCMGKPSMALPTCLCCGHTYVQTCMRACCELLHGADSAQDVAACVLQVACLHRAITHACMAVRPAAVQATFGIATHAAHGYRHGHLPPAPKPAWPGGLPPWLRTMVVSIVGGACHSMPGWLRCHAAAWQMNARWIGSYTPEGACPCQHWYSRLSTHAEHAQRRPAGGCAASTRIQTCKNISWHYRNCITS